MTMSARILIKEIRLKLGLSTPQLSERLGFKSKAHVWLVEKGIREPSILMCKRLIKLCKEERVMMNLTIDKLRGDE